MVRIFRLMLVLFYIYSTNIPPIMIIHVNRIYETQNLLSLWLISFPGGLRTYRHPCIRIGTRRMNRYSLDSIVIGYYLNVLGGVVRFVARTKNLSLYNSIKVGSGSDPASGSLCTRVPFPESKPAEA
jgi:hypothetical protein